MSARVARFFNFLTRLGPGTRFAARLHGLLFRLTRGRAIGRWFGAPVLVMETVGRRSGKPRSTPIIYMPDGERLVVTPANAGATRTPAWWLNLQAAGYGFTVLAGKRERVLPRVTRGEERERLWRRFSERFPALERYKNFTDRDFPMIVLEPASGEDYPPGD